MCVCLFSGSSCVVERWLVLAGQLVSHVQRWRKIRDSWRWKDKGNLITLYFLKITVRLVVKLPGYKQVITQVLNTTEIILYYTKVRNTFFVLDLIRKFISFSFSSTESCSSVFTAFIDMTMSEATVTNVSWTLGPWAELTSRCEVPGGLWEFEFKLLLRWNEALHMCL